MTRTRMKFPARSSWPLVLAALLVALVSATTVVFTGDALSQGLMNLRHRATLIATGPTSVIDDYVQGLAKAVPGSVHR
jgi:hypothetical protein